MALIPVVGRTKITISLDERTGDRLEREALADRRSRSALARLMIQDALADRERQGERVNR
jgi:hypothetical protein